MHLDQGEHLHRVPTRQSTIIFLASRVRVHKGVLIITVREFSGVLCVTSPCARLSGQRLKAGDFNRAMTLAMIPWHPSCHDCITATV